MQVSLVDRDKVSMIFLGDPLNFTYDTPGPVTVELESLSEAQKNQLIYNWRRGVLMVDNPEELKSACEMLPAASPKFSTPTEQPIGKPKDPIVTMAEEAETTRAKLRALLKEKMPVIKAQVAHMPVNRVKLLLALEQKWKKRKAVISMFEELINKHAQTVIGIVGQDDVGGKVFDPKAEALDKDQEVLDYESEEVTFNIPTDEELSKANG